MPWITGDTAVPPALLALLLAGAGLIVGSFLGLVSLRLPTDRPIVMDRSRCGGCGKALPPWRMIPVVRYLIAKGRCADCRSAIPTRYPLIELAAAGIGVWAALAQPDLPAAVFTALLGWQLLLIAIVDGEHFWLPDHLTLPLFLTGLGAALVLPGLTLRDSLIGAATGFLLLWGLARAYRRIRGREGLGGGDPLLLAAGGAWVGWIGLPSVLLWAAAAGLSLVAARLALRRPVAGTDRLPFGVFLAIGAWCVWLWGPLGL